jgi:asparagine synthase (glutamine-hydrolysing)
MCGIAGFWDVGRAISHDSGLATLKVITDSIRHRGPDDEGAWLDPPAGLALGFRRLAIIDTSALGHQPMASASGRYVIVFNGEIYNYRDIRAELEAQGPIAWRGHSDTEVMLAAIDRWGFDATLSRLNGMFAIALWDRRERVLHLARDRFGEKPLYYGWAGRTFLFGSELKALKRHPAWVGEVRRDAVSAYTRYGYVPSPMSIYRGIVKLPPAHAITITAGASPGLLPPPRCYWDVHAVADAGIANRLTLDEHELTECLDGALQKSVRSRMEADVPLGAFLSGGIDSSTVVALMQAASSRPVRTFTIGFGEPAFNEAPFGAAVAKHLGTQHEELYVSADQALAVVPKIASMYDEPFGDASQIPTYLVAALARKHVTVAL